MATNPPAFSDGAWAAGRMAGDPRRSRQGMRPFCFPKLLSAVLSAGIPGIRRGFLVFLLGLPAWMAVGFSGEGGATDATSDTPAVSSGVASRLVDSPSPYLRECARQAVPWRVWGREAFEQARRLDRLVFLDSSMPWSNACRMMDRENYADAKVVERFARGFVCVRLDAEERPDVDGRYQRLHQLLHRGRAAGHPLLAFLTPEGDLVFSSSYLPRTSPDGRAFPELLDRVEELWSRQRDDARRQASALTSLFAALPQHSLSHELPLGGEDADAVYKGLMAVCHPAYAGFGPAQGPRFPAPEALRFLLERAVERNEPRDLDTARRILLAMCRGAITDVLDGGIHRCTVDGQWRRPRHEKLLHGNAAHLELLCLAHQLSPDPEFESAARATLNFLRARMSRKDGGFAASIAATPAEAETAPEDHWGWTAEQVRALLPADSARLACLIWGIPDSSSSASAPASPPVSASSPAAEPVSLFQAMTLAEAQRRMSRLSLDRLEQMREQARKTLLDARNKRPAPARDERLFTAPNARMVSALWRYAEVFSDPAAAESARQTLELLERDAARADGLFSHEARPRSGDGGGPFLADQVAMLTARLETHEATGEPQFLERAKLLARRILDTFADPSGITLTDRPRGDDDVATGPLLLPLIVYEDAETPGPISEFACQLLRLERATGEADWGGQARRLLRPAVAAVRESGHLYATWGLAAAAWNNPLSVHIVGDPDDPKTRALLAVARARFPPRMVIAVHPPGAPLPWLDPATRPSRHPAAYWVGKRSSAFVYTPTDLENLLAEAFRPDPK